MDEKKDAASCRDPSTDTDCRAGFREFFRSAARDEGRFAFRLSIFLFACVFAILPLSPLAGVILLIFCLLNSPHRQAVGALMLSVITAYVWFAYMTVTNRWSLPLIECMAVALAVAAGLQVRTRYEAIAQVMHRRYFTLQRLVAIDELTAVYSRRHILELGQREFDRSNRTGRPLSVLMLDIDNLKEINDSMGHAAGDEALLLVSSALRQGLRSQDMAGRYGGDEFLIVLTETAADGARETALRLQHILRREHLISAQGCFCTRVSIGIATRSAEIADFSSLITQADLALYDAKSAGRDQIRLSRVGSTRSDSL